MSEVDPREFGRLEAEVQSLQSEVAELRADVKTLLELANKSKGGLWAGMTLVGLFSSAATWFISHLPFFRS